MNTQNPPKKDSPPVCKHGNPYFCGMCDAEQAPKCRHGNAFYCGFCFQETGEGRVASEKEARDLLPAGTPGNGISQILQGARRRP